MKKSLLITLFVLLAHLSQSQIFEKITFQTSYCFGTCPVYYLELKADKTFKLYAEKVYLANSNTRELYPSQMINPQQTSHTMMIGQVFLLMY